MFKLLPFSFLLLLIFNFIAFAQETEKKERPRLIDFGASLRADYEKKQNEAKSLEPAIPGEEVIKIDTDLVVSDILVLNEKGFAVSNLSKDDFVVDEDQTPQAVETFSQGNDGVVPRSIVLVMDYSGSLLPFIKTSVVAAKVLVDKLKPKDRMAIVTDDVELLTDFTRDKQLLKEKLDSLENSALVKKKLGRSEQYSALLATLNELFDAEDIRPIVIFQTDGDEISTLKGNFVPPPIPKNLPKNFKLPEIKEKNFSYADIITAAERARATIYTVIPGTRYINIPEEQQMERAKKDVEVRRNLSAERSTPPSIPAHLKKRIEKMQKELFERTIEETAKYYIDSRLTMHRPVVSLAFTTGGWAEHIETPEQAEEIYTRILWDINNRYIIGYYPSNQTKDGKRRAIKIAVKNHPEYKILARRNYYAPEN